MQQISTFATLTDQYQHFVFDQYGVLHDGVTPYPNMADEIRNLKKAGKTVSVISNSGKRAAVNVERLKRFGYDESLIDTVYTSGEIAWHQLQNWSQEKSDTALRVYFLGTDDDRSAIDGLGLREVTDTADSDLVIIAGMGTGPKDKDYYRQSLRDAAGRKVPAFCTNPDWYQLLGGGKKSMGPGQIAHIYQSLGGVCTYFGKPHPEIYRYMFNCSKIDAQQTVCIGDSVAHDIVGASRAGCDSILAATGVHEHLSAHELQEIIKNEQCEPDYFIKT